MKQKNLIKSLLYLGTCAAVLSVVIIKRDKISKTVNKTFNKRFKKKIKAQLKSAVHNVSISKDAIALRAYELFISGAGGSQEEHWLWAERELAKRLK